MELDDANLFAAVGSRVHMLRARVALIARFSVRGPMTTPIIRPYLPADEAGIVALILPIQQHEFGMAIRATDQPDLSSIPAFYQSGSGGFWVAELDGRVVGTIGLKDIDYGQGALRKMFVAARCRGREQGAAARLLGTLVAHARAGEMSKLYLGTNETLLAAHRFYEKNGFVEISQSELPPSFPVMDVDRKFYLLALG